MSLSTRFLNLSMKEQICLTIILLTLFCILVILILCGSLMYEILMKDYEQKKSYFYNKYKDYMESVFYFQSFYTMQYEEIIHKMQKEIWKIRQSVEVYNTLRPLQNYSDYIINMSESHNYTELEEKNNKENPYFYIISYNTQAQQYVREFSLNFYQLFANSLVSNDIYNGFKMPGYNVPIFDQPIFYNKNFLAIFGCNQSKINNDINNLREPKGEILGSIIENNINYAINMADDYLEYVSNKLDLLQQMFSKCTKELFGFSSDIFTNPEARHELSEILTAYVSNIDYENNNISLVTTDSNKNYFFVKMNIIPETIFFLMKNITYSLDIDFIPFKYPLSSLISPELCSLFKIKQNILAGNKFDFEQIYSEIHKGVSHLSDCFIDNKLIDSQEEMKEIFDLFFDNFTELNNTIYQGIINIIPDDDDNPFYFIKYSYPNYNSLREFQSEYFFINQINFFAFASFKTAKKYVDHVFQVSQNIFFFIVMIIIYSWLFCLFVNIIIFYKIIDELTEPISKLQEAVESSSIKNEDIFIYKNDDIINELFLTCKELLSGQIDNSNNENELQNFHPEKEKEKDKKIDKNIYKKNLIINNEIMEELINNKV